MLRARPLLLAAFPVFCASAALAQPTVDPAVANDLTLELMTNDLSQPTSAQFLPDGRLLIFQKSGEILVADGTVGATATQIGSITVPTNSERGLLNMAVDPMFTTTNRVYIYYSAGNSQSVGYVTINGNTVSAPTPLLTGLSGSNNHDGGGLTFGPDGLLYISVGDTGCNCNCSPGNADNYFGTCLTRLHGKVLRIDRDGNIPATNPLVGVNEVASCGAQQNCNTAPDISTGAPPRTEIYNWGFRNPWRIAFDEQSGYLWIGDVGEITFEEINISTGPAQHFGWPYREGDQGDAPTTCEMITPTAPGDCKEPAAFFGHNNGAVSITGGVFSNHCSWPAALSGLYWFADYGATRVWTLEPNATRDGVTGQRESKIRNAGGIIHFFNGPDGAVYFVSINSGQIWKMTPTNPINCGGVDAGPDDAGLPEDTGVPADTGVPVDTGVALDADTDSGVVRDSGPTPDSGVVADSGVAVDAGTADTGAPAEEEDSGCGCTSHAQGRTGLGTLFGAIVVFAFLRRRR